MRKGIVWALVVAGLALVIAAIWIPDTETHRVKIVSPPSIIAALPHWVAEERRLYDKQNIEVQTISFNSSDLMVRSLYGGDADFLPAVSLLDVALAAIKQGSDEVRIVSHSRMKPSPAFEAIVVPTGSPIQTLRDLAGKKIAVYPGATSANIVRYYLRKNGVDTSRIQLLPLPPPVHLQALVNGDVDASHLYDPLRSRYLLELSGRALSPSIYGTLNPGSAIGVTVLSQRFAQQDPAAARRLLAVWDEAIDIIRDEPDFARSVLAKRMELTPEIARAATWVDATKTTELSPPTIEATLKTLEEAGILPHGEPVPTEIYQPISR